MNVLVLREDFAAKAQLNDGPGDCAPQALPLVKKRQIGFPVPTRRKVSDRYCLAMGGGAPADRVIWQGNRGHRAMNHVGIRRAGQEQFLMVSPFHIAES